MQRLFLDHHLTRAHGLPLEALRELRARAEAPRLSRRAFLAGAAAGAVAYSLPRRARAERGPTIAIVGAGIAGLCCALHLADHGLSSTVYEASGRVGGRMFSNVGYFDDHQVSEWCAELIDTDNIVLQRLAARFGLALDDLKAAEVPGAEETYHFDGSYYPKAEADADFAAIYPIIALDLAAAGDIARHDSITPAGRALDSISVHDWIASRVPGGHRSRLGQLLDTAYVIQHGSETRDQSALDIVYFLGRQPVGVNRRFKLFGVSDERYHVRGGNQQIPEAIARSLGGSIQRDHRLLRIEQTPAGRSTLTFARGRGTVEVVADLVVLALPFAVLRNLDYSRAGFDARKTLAIRELGRAHNGKTQVQFTERLWTMPGPWPGRSNGSSYADTGYQNTWEVSRAQYCRSGILVFYTGGPITDALTTNVPFATAKTPGVLDDARTLLRRAEPVFPGLSALCNGKVTQSLPHLSDLREASYSYHRVGQYAAFAGHEGERQGNVLFCGEHTSLTHPAHMEGAAREGMRAARDILGLLAQSVPEEHR
ncbi:hypothetical protein A7982_12628 [Minicystis rosea]|nr:hypothetical protein A7982_12628 [Minicystis rosea]